MLKEIFFTEDIHARSFEVTRQKAVGEAVFYDSVGLVGSSNSLAVKIWDKTNCFLAQGEN